jgi:hypothetical protein
MEEDGGLKTMPQNIDCACACRKVFNFPAMTGRSFLQFVFCSVIACMAQGCMLPLASGEVKTVRTMQLSPTHYNSLRELIGAAGPTADTVIIHYTFNRESCWNALDQNETNEQILKRIQNITQGKAAILSQRQNISFFEFREPGKNISKIKLLDPSVKTDSTRFLRNSIFVKPYACGTSAIILPTGAVYLLYSDAHNLALYKTAEIIAAAR